MKHREVDNRIVGTLVCVLFLAAIFIQTKAKEQQERFENDRKERAEAALYGPLGNVPLEAKAAYVYDLTRNKIIYVRHEGWKLPLASLTKIMTTIVAKEVLPTDAVITIPHAAISQEGDSGLKEGEQWPLTNLLQIMLVGSSNDAAHAIALAAENVLAPANIEQATVSPNTLSHFIQKMNETAQTLHLERTSFSNETGLDISVSDNGGYGSAQDIATLLKYAYDKYPDLFGPTTYPQITTSSASGTSHTLKNTDTITGSVASLLASKTGYTKIAGGNLAILFDVRPNEPVIAVVLGSTREGRFDDMETLVRAAHAWRDRIDTAVASTENQAAPAL